MSPAAGGRRQPSDASSSAPAGVPDELVERVNQALPAAVQARGRAFVTGTVLAGREAVRACLINPAVAEADLLVLVAEVRAAGAQLLTSLGEPALR